MSADSPTGPRPDPTASILGRLRRIEGQVRGIAGMVEDGRLGVETLTQIAAARAALAAAGVELIDAQTRAAVASGAEADVVASEALRATRRLLGCHDATSGN